MTILSMKKWTLEYIEKELHHVPLDGWDSAGEEQFGISQSFIMRISMIIHKAIEIVIIWPLISLNTLLIGITYMCIGWF